MKILGKLLTCLIVLLISNLQASGASKEVDDLVTATTLLDLSNVAAAESDPASKPRRRGPWWKDVKPWWKGRPAWEADYDLDEDLYRSVPVASNPADFREDVLFKKLLAEYDTIELQGVLDDLLDMLRNYTELGGDPQSIEIRKLRAKIGLVYSAISKQRRGLSSMEDVTLG